VADYDGNPQSTVMQCDLLDADDCKRRMSFCNTRRDLFRHNTSEEDANGFMFFWNCLWSVKGSLLMLYRRLFTCVNGYMKWWWVVAAACVLTWAISILTNFIACLPLRRRFFFGSQKLGPSLYLIGGRRYRANTYVQMLAQSQVVLTLSGLRLALILQRTSCLECSLFVF
jgi:hypothetical protein